MSPLLITSSIIFLVLFCAVVYVVENWIFWKSTGSGPRRWGWIQSWSKGWKRFLDPTGDLDRMTLDFKADNAARQKKLDEWRAFNTMMSEEIKAYGVKKVAEEIKEASDRMRKMDELRKIKNDKFPQHIIDRVHGKTQYQARELYNDGWRTAGGIDQSGRRILVRGESHAYVSLDVWTEVERLAKRPLHKTTNNPILFANELYEKGWTCGGGIDPETRHRVVCKDGQFVYVQIETWEELSRIWRQNSCTERPAVVGENGPETITVNGSTLHVHEGSSILDWSKIPPASSSNVDWKQFQAYGTTYEEYKKALKTLADKQKDRTQVTEVNEVPDTFTHMSDASRYVAYGLSFDVGEGKTVLIKYRNAKKRFLPSVNPLGDTAAHMIEVTSTRYESGTHRDVNGFGSSNYEGIKTTTRSFRHKKGGSRGK